MNVFNKVICRCYQFCFRLVMPILPYRSESMIMPNYEELYNI